MSVQYLFPPDESSPENRKPNSKQIRKASKDKICKEIFDELGGFDVEKRKPKENFQLYTFLDRLNLSKQKFLSGDSDHLSDRIQTPC